MSNVSVCEGCAEQVDPEDPSLVHARVAEDTSGDLRDDPLVEVDAGPDALFHLWCFPSDSPVWRRRA